MPTPFSSVFQWLQDTPPAQAIAESNWMFPTLETVHVLAICTVVGTIMMVDLRLLNWASKGRTVRAVASELVPWTLVAFLIAALSGFGMFISKATDYVAIWAFQIKILLILLAGINMLIFHFFVYPKATAWPASAPPLSATIAGALSLTFWIAIVVLGRWIGFLEL